MRAGAPSRPRAASCPIRPDPRSRRAARREHVEHSELLVGQLEDAPVGVLDVESQRMLDAHVVSERVESTRMPSSPPRWFPRRQKSQTSTSRASRSPTYRSRSVSISTSVMFGTDSRE
jgi:hypothetical protein